MPHELASENLVELEEDDDEEGVENEWKQPAEKGNRGAMTPPASALLVSERYDFTLPRDICVVDFLTVQLAECARMTQSLSDRVVGQPLEVYERSQTINSIGDVVAASGDLAECIDRMHGGTGWRSEPPRPRKTVRSR